MQIGVFLKHSNCARRVLPVVLVAFLLAGCASLAGTRQALVTEMEVLSSGHTFGQTFVAEYDGLEAVYFFLNPHVIGDGEIRLHLRSSPQAGEDLAVSLNVLSIATFQEAGFQGFYFPPQPSSSQSYYYAFLELTGSGEVQVGRTGGDTYLNGAWYQDGISQDAQAAFQLNYSSPSAIGGLVREAAAGAGVLAVAAFLFLLPGWGLLGWLLQGWKKLHWMEKAGLSASLSLALFPLLTLWADVLGLQPAALLAWLPPLAGAGLILWRNRKGINFRSLRSLSCWLAEPWARISLVLVLVLIFGLRLWAIRLLDAPQWSDSLQHTVIAQLLLDHGGLFDSWVPYAPYGTFTIQFGFPVDVAVYSWLGGGDSVKGTLLVGQAVNGLGVIALYPLAVRISKGNRWAGVGAVLVAGLLSPLPAYYVNWGRYAQLAGQAVLPGALWLIWEVLSPSTGMEKNKLHPGGRAAGMALAVLALAGMTLTYYRMPFYYLTFILALSVAWGLPHWRLDGRTWVRKLGLLAAVGGLAVLLVLPWAFRLAGSSLAGSLEGGITRGSSLQAVLADYQSWLALFSLVPAWLVILTLVGIAWSLLRRSWMVAAQGLWVLLLTSIIAGMLIHLPGANMLSTFAILVFLYIPIALVLGWMLAQVAGQGKAGWRPALTAMLVILAALLGSYDQRNIAQPSTFTYVTRPDMHALAWVRENVPGSANFLVEGVTFGSRSIIGSDAGLWIPLLAGRQNSIPPQYALLDEVPIQPGYTQQMIALVKALETTSPGSQEGLAAVCSEGISHVYIGQGQGGSVQRAMTRDYPPLFSPQDLLESPAYHLLYHLDRVYIFALDPTACP